MVQKMDGLRLKSVKSFLEARRAGGSFDTAWLGLDGLGGSLECGMVGEDIYAGRTTELYAPRRPQR